MLFIAACTPTATVEPDPSPEPAETPTVTLPELPDGIDADEIVEFISEARWVFEQQILPMAVFQDVDFIVELIEDADTDGMKEALVELWGFVVEMMLMNSYDLGGTFSLDELGMGSEHIMEVTIESLDEETTAFIIKMLDIDQVRRSTYIGIVYRETEGVRMFTLEQSYGFHMFCFVGADSRGSFFEVENDRGAFIAAIIEVLETGEEAGAGIQWSR